MAKSETLLSILLILAMLSVVSLGTFAYLNDVETAGQNIISAGTLDLKVDGKDNPLPVKISVDNVAPSWTATYKWLLKNVGTIKDVKAQMHIVVTQNLENGYTEPEALVDTTPDEGELASVLMIQIYFNGGLVTTGYLADLDCNMMTLPPWQSDWAANEVRLKLSIDSEVGNIIQGDSVEFDIEFRLDQKL